MVRRDKENSSYIFDLVYDQLSRATVYPYINLGLIFIQNGLFLVKLYQLISPGYFQILFNNMAFFLGLSALVAGFILFTFLSSYFQMFPTIWIYWLLLIEALQVIYFQMGIECLGAGQWCQNDSKIQIVSMVVIGLMVIIVWFRSYCYCPFYEIDNPFSMITGKSVIYTLIYSAVLTLMTEQIIASSSASAQLAFVSSIIFFAFNSPPSHCSPLMCRGYFVSGSTIIWTTCLIWLLPLLEDALGTTAGSIWHYWGFSTPIVICLSWVHSAKFDKGYDWRSLFFLRTGKEDLRILFLQVNQLVKVTSDIKKSDLRTISPEFRNLWGIAADHNEKCTNPDCPIATLKSMRSSAEDDLVEQKRFTRTLEKILEYTLYMLTRQYDTYPNLLTLRLEIANFQLEVFHLRTKGLHLFSKQWGKGRPTEEQWSIYYLKRKIDGFEGDGEGIGEKEEEISSFKHDIEVSVTMLAEFWYFLSDPKCNIKKLYDLANVLFPLKIGVDEAWTTVKTLKNIQTYHLYARYLIRMFNDKEKGLKILEEGRRLEMEAHDKEVVMAGAEGTSEENGVIFLEFDGKNSGIMYQVNMACEKMFGYNKGELQGRKVNDIMPKLFSVHHDQILEHYQQTNRPRMMNKDRAVWGKAKDGFLFPFTICIKPVRNYFSQTSEVYANVKRELWVKEKGFFFVDNNLHITDMSASMIHIYPDIASRMHLKKKIHLSEILPQPEKELTRLVQHRETIEQSIVRTYPVSATANFSETITFGLQAERVSAAATGPIGYHFRVFKGSGVTSFQQREEEEVKMEMKGDKRDFRFIASVGEDGKGMVFQGGISHDSKLLRSQMLSRISNCLDQSRKLNNSELEMQVRIDYAGEIKIKRLMGNVIRQIHELSEDSELNRAIGPDNKEEEGEVGEGIKPSQLNAILERNEGSKSISLLKILTIVMIALSTLLVVLQYMSMISSHSQITDRMHDFLSLSSLETQLMALNQYANRIYIGATVNLTSLGQEVNLLDSLTQAIPFDISSQLTYNDGTSQQMLLSFAINKLISEAQMIADGLGDASHIFFLQYNTVNGLSAGCQQALKKLDEQTSQNVQRQETNREIYLIISGCLFGIILIVKNIVVRQVLHKKAEILNVFFEIPRYSCSIFQKECQRFIQRLSSDNNDEEELELDGIPGEEGDDSSSGKRRSQQKKRTIMGEEKTSSNFILVSLLMLAFFMTFPTIGLVLHKQGQSKQMFSVQTADKIMRLEMHLAKLNSLLDTHVVRTSFPLSESSDAWTVITAQYQLILQMLTEVTTNLFLLGKVLDEQYLTQYNKLLYQNLCLSSSTSCRINLGEDKGLNNILFNYYDSLIAQYQLVLSATPPYNATILYSNSAQAEEEGFREVMKEYWNELQKNLIDGISRLVVEYDGILFGILLAICIVNWTVLMWGWISFYNSLEDKMMATEYILTFIPIDEINKNPKIVRYIKEQILRVQ